jgi:hypothetical protein
MFLEHGVASCSFGSVLLAVGNATEWGAANSPPARKTYLYVSMNHLSSRFRLV